MQPGSSDAQLVEAQFSAQAGNPVVHRLTVGGADAVAYGPPGSDANFSLVALQRADGTVKGQWQDSFGHGGGFHIQVDCLYIDGSDAWVSGPITKANDPDNIGRTANAMVRDGGETGDDMVSPIFFRLPYTCVDQFPFDDYGLLWPVNNGQVKLK
jgi:hypothetical protein